MSASLPYPQPLRLGYFLPHTDVHVFGHPQMPYRGVDRLANPGWYHGEEASQWIINPASVPPDKELLAAL